MTTMPTMLATPVVPAPTPTACVACGTAHGGPWLPWAGVGGPAWVLTTAGPMCVACLFPAPPMGG